MEIGSFSMGLDTFKIDMTMYKESRNKFLELTRVVLGHSGIALFQGGESKTRHDTDHELLFRQESYFSYLFGVTEPDFFGIINFHSGESSLFIPRLNPSYAIWMGEIKGPEYFKEKYCVDHAGYVDELAEIIKNVAASEGDEFKVYVLSGLNTDSGNYSSPAKIEGIEGIPVDTTSIHPILSECRVIKSPKEIQLMKYVNRISSEAHVEVMRSTKVGMKEYQMEANFQHFVYFKGGCRHCSYTCICATGNNSSVLHYGHAGAPNDKVNGKFTENQKIVYNAVLSAQKAVISSLKPGISWVDMHRLAERKILECLKGGGLLLGDIEEMMEVHLGAIFMPHGLGHFLGVDTHDVGGYPKGSTRIDKPGLKSLRTTRTLEAGMVLTVEPGCYFINTLLDSALANEIQAKFLNQERIAEFRGSGGVRLEDDLVITENGCENMTLCPREVEDVEAVLSGGVWVFE